MNLRPALLSDYGFLLRMANDEAMIAARPDGHRIGLLEHLLWLVRALLNPSVELWVAEDSGERVGEVRVNRRGTIGEVGLVVAPEVRGQGYGSRMIAQAVQVSAMDRFYARIGAPNVASWRAFHRAGFECVYGAGVAVYQKRTT